MTRFTQPCPSSAKWFNHKKAQKKPRGVKSFVPFGLLLCLFVVIHHVVRFAEFGAKAIRRITC